MGVPIATLSAVVLKTRAVPIASTVGGTGFCTADRLTDLP